MYWKNTNSFYGAIAKTFHWLMAIMVIGMLTVGLYMGSLEVSPLKLQLYGWHKSFGILILALVVLRIGWRNFTTPPALPENMNNTERFLARSSHILLYMFMIYMPLVGWLMSSAAGFHVSVFGLFTLPDLMTPDRELMQLFREMHDLGGYLLIGLICLHVAAALKHHFIDKDDVLKRMLPW